MTSSPNSPQEDLPPVIKHLQQKNKQRKLKEQDDKYKYDTNSKWIMDYPYPLYSPYTNVLIGKMTTTQWQLIHSIITDKQQSVMKTSNSYNELSDILDKLYPLAYKHDTTILGDK